MFPCLFFISQYRVVHKLLQIRELTEGSSDNYGESFPKFTNVSYQRDSSVHLASPLEQIMLQSENLGIYQVTRNNENSAMTGDGVPRRAKIMDDETIS